MRFIGVDTPKIKRPSKPVERMGQEAFEANRKLVEGKRVKLEFDAERYDRYGRVLAYVYVGTTFVNAWLVEAGYAQVMTIPPNVKYAELFLELQREAREAGRGLWAEDEKEGKPEPGQVYYASAKSDKFHYPWCTWAKEIKPENLIVFESREDALKAGYVPCKVCEPWGNGDARGDARRLGGHPGAGVGSPVGGAVQRVRGGGAVGQERLRAS